MLLPLVVLAALGEAKTIIAAVGETDYGQVLTDIIAMRPNATILVGYPVPYACPLSGLKCKGMWGSDTSIITPSARKSEDLIGIDRPSFAKMKSQNDGAAPPVALRSPAPPPPSPFWKRLFGGAAEEDEEEAAEPRPSWSRMTPPSAEPTEEPSSPADLAAADSIPLEDAILSVIDPPELRPRASRAPTPPPQRQGFGRGPSAAIIASPRNVVIEPVPRVARTTSSQEVDELFEATTPPGAPPAADARVQGAERAEQVVREAGIGGNDDDDDAFKY